MGSSSSHPHAAPVVVGVDGSPGSDRAVRFATLEAQRVHAEVRLLHVSPDYVAVSPMLPLVPEELEPTAREILAAAALVAEGAVRPPGPVVTQVLAAGGVVPGLVTGSQDASLVVLGSDDRAPLHRLFTGAVTAGFASRSPCPVVAVPRGWEPTEPRGRIVAGIKGPAHAPELLARAFDLAASLGSQLVLVHAWEMISGYDDIIEQRVDRETLRRQGESTLESLLTEWRRAYPQVPVELRVVHGQPARVLVDAGARADRLLLVRKGHGFPSHLGGVARAVLREATCPVEVVPHVAEESAPIPLVLEEAGTLQK